MEKADSPLTNKALDPEPPIASFLNSVLIGGGPVGGRKSVGAKDQLFDWVRRNENVPSWSGEDCVAIGKLPFRRI